MSAILIGLTARYGLSGVRVAGALAGVVLILLGLFRLGRYIAFIPSPVITGFTSGIALIIAIGQLDNVLGIKLPPAENTFLKIAAYAEHPMVPDWQAVTVALIVIGTMFLLPLITAKIPGSLVGIVIATITTNLAGWDVPLIGAVPGSLVLDQRLSLYSP